MLLLAGTCRLRLRRNARGSGANKRRVRSGNDACLFFPIYVSKTENMTLEISLRVTGQSNQGGRKYMEDAFVVAYQETDDKKDLEYAFFGIFDGHGGKEAALYAKNNLLDNIVNFKNFWQDDDELVLKAIRDGFLTTHLAMWKEVGK